MSKKYNKKVYDSNLKQKILDIQIIKAQYNNKLHTLKKYNTIIEINKPKYK